MDLHRDVLAPAERAADAGEREAHLVLRQGERSGDLVAVDVQPLGRDEEVDPAVLGGHREPGLRPEERLVLHPHLVLAADHDVGLARLGRRARSARGAAGCPRGAAADSTGRARTRGRRAARAPRSRPRSGRPRAAPSPGGRRRRSPPARPGSARRSNASTGWSGSSSPYVLRPGTSSWVSTACTPGTRERGADLDRADPRPRVRAAQRRAPQHVLGPHVRRVGELALDLRDPVRAADALADAVADRRDRAHGRPPRRGPRSSRAARARSLEQVARDLLASAVRSSPSATTTSRPPTSSGPRAGVRRARARRPGRRSRRGRRRRAATARRRRACPARASPSSSSRPRQRAPCDRAQLERLRAHVSAPGPPASASEQQRLRAARRPARRASLDAAPSTPRPTGAPAPQQRRDRRDARRRAARWRSGSARRRCRSRRSARSRRR